MTREEFKREYSLAIGKWRVIDKLVYDSQYRTEGWNAGYAGCIPDDEFLQNKNFMEGYKDGYSCRFY